MIENEQEIREALSDARTMHDLLGRVGASDVRYMLIELDELRAENAGLRETIVDISADNVKLHAAFEILRPQADLQIENARLMAENARLRAALEAVEWINIGYAEWDIATRQCPWCRKEWQDGHKPGCQRQFALGLAVKL